MTRPQKRARNRRRRGGLWRVHTGPVGDVVDEGADTDPMSLDYVKHVTGVLLEIGTDDGIGLLVADAAMNGSAREGKWGLLTLDLPVCVERRCAGVCLRTRLLDCIPHRLAGLDFITTDLLKRTQRGVRACGWE
jgi:hypothetical protein